MSSAKKLRRARDVACDVVHFIAGFITYFFPPLLLIFFVYQVLEKEKTVEKVGDFLEFILGLIFAVLIFIKT